MKEVMWFLTGLAGQYALAMLTHFPGEKFLPSKERWKISPASGSIYLVFSESNEALSIFNILTPSWLVKQVTGLAPE